MLRLLPALPVFLLVTAIGCTTTRTITINAKPSDATIKVDGVERGKGSVVQQIVFEGKDDVHTVAVSRIGYKEERKSITKDDASETLNFELGYLTRRLTFNVTPFPGHITVDGKQITTEPTDTTSIELPFTVDARNNWTAHTVVAEREGWEPATQTVAWQDQDQRYTLRLEPRKKDLILSTTPPGAQLLLNNEDVGTSPLSIRDHPFPVNVDSGAVIPQRIRAVRPGYDPVEVRIGWDDGKTHYSLNLIPKTKTVRIITDPAGGAVVIDGKELPRERNGVSTATLTFPPTNEKGELKTYIATAAKKTADSEWYPQKLTIGWDDGKADYSVALKEILTTPVTLLAPTLERSDGGWEVVPKIIFNTIAWKDVGEGNQKSPPVQLTRLPRGTQIDTLAVSPDGTNLLFTILYGSDRTNFRSQIVMIRTDGTQGADYLNDGKSLEITPSFWPAGEKIVFASNRAGRRLSVWSMSAQGAPGITQLTTGDTNDLWPTIDNDPKPRLFYQASVDTRPDPRIYMTQLNTTTRTDLTQSGGSQPRVSPKADAVAFCAVNDKTGKRDIYLMSDRGGNPANLTNTPDVDEFDPAFSKDGTRIAFVSDAGVDEERHHNFDIWVMDVARPDRPMQITTNGSWDDHPAWDPSGNTIYFRSNRGGEWNIWRIATR